MPGYLQETLARKKDYLELLWTEAKRLVPVLKASGAEEVYVFGSLVKGTAYLESDLDLLVVASSSLPPPERNVAFYETVAAAGPKVPVDLLVFTPVEVNSPRKSRSLARLLAEGVKL